jgi:hypothetical protein
MNTFIYRHACAVLRDAIAAGALVAFLGALTDKGMC